MMSENENVTQEEILAKVDYEFSHRLNHTLHAYIDISGDLIAGTLLSQIMYWFSKDKNGKQRVRIYKDGNYWLAKGREDWYEEIRISPKQYDNAIKKLKDKGLVETALYKFNAVPTTHIRPVYEKINKEIGKWKENVAKSIIENDNYGFTQIGNSDLPKGENGISQKGETEISQTVNSITEITNKDYSNRDYLSENTKADTSKTSFEEQVDTCSSRKSKADTTKKKTKQELQELETDMKKRFAKITKEQCDKGYITDCSCKNIIQAFLHYMEIYTQKTGKVHPILGDAELYRIVDVLANIYDTEYSHFENVADVEAYGEEPDYLYEMVDTHFNTEHRQKTDWHMSHFANSNYLELLAQRVVEY